MALGLQPYRKAIVSRNAPLCKACPCFSIGKVVSHADDPFYCASFISLGVVGFKRLLTLSASSCRFFRLFIFMFLRRSSICISIPCPPFSRCSFAVARGLTLINGGALLPCSVVCQYLRRVGKANNRLSSLLMCFLPRIAGSNSYLKVSLIGCADVAGCTC